MNKIKKYGIVILLLLIVVLSPKGKIGIDKKEVKENALTNDNKFAHIILSAWIKKTDEVGNPMSNVLFKVSTNNDIFSAYTVEPESGYYYVEKEYQGNNYFNDAYKILTKEQQERISTIKTTKDFFQFPNSEFINCDNGTEIVTDTESNNVQERVGEDYYCYLALPTIYTLEEVTAPEGYVKEKVIMLGRITLGYAVKGYLQPAARKQSPNENYRLSEEFEYNTYPVELESINVNLEHEMIGNYLEYGQIPTNELVGLDIEKRNRNIQNIGLINKNCLPPEKLPFRRIESTENVESDGDISRPIILEPVPSASEGSLPNCYLSLQNKKGEVKLEISNYVNNREQITTVRENKVEYKVNVKNVGNADAVSTKVISILPEGFEYVENSASNGGRYEDGKIIWEVDRINTGKDITLTYQAYAKEGVDVTKEYEGQAYLENTNLKKIEANRTLVKLSMTNPMTLVPYSMIIIVPLITIVFAIYLEWTLKKEGERNEKNM